MIIDSSFLISFYDKDDSNHGKAVEILEKNRTRVLMAPEQVIGETATVILYKKGLSASKEFLSVIQQTENFQIIFTAGEDFSKTVEIYANQKHQLSFIDALVVYLAKKTGLDVLTFDKNMIKELNDE